MGDLKWITQKEFEAYLRVKEFIEKDNFGEVDLRKKIRDRKPTRIPLIIRSDDMVPKKYECLTDAASDIKVAREKSLPDIKEATKDLTSTLNHMIYSFYAPWKNGPQRVV